jgi:hypothetical protein
MSCDRSGSPFAPRGMRRRSPGTEAATGPRCQLIGRISETCHAAQAKTIGATPNHLVRGRVASWFPLDTRGAP